MMWEVYCHYYVRISEMSESALSIDISKILSHDVYKAKEALHIIRIANNISHVLFIIDGSIVNHGF